MIDTASGTQSRPTGLTILGATGSVGRSTLDVIARHPGRYRVFALSAHVAGDVLLDLCRIHHPRHAVLSGLAEDAAIGARFARAAPETELLFGPDALSQVATSPECDVVMAAIVGAAGLVPTLRAAAAGKRLLLANKEALVMAGPIFMRTLRASGAVLLPIDSEHNAVFQCLAPDAAGRASMAGVRRILLTASGGPFRTASPERLAQVTPDEACAHPNWVMGRKISVDSATMMNKGLEVIEAHWLFGLPAERIQVMIHPQSIVHSLVEYADGSLIAQLSNPDMRVPIAHALGFPERIESGARPLELESIAQLSFERSDPARFPCLEFAYAALRAGGTAPALLNAANEVAVQEFLDHRLRFTDIARVIGAVLDDIAAVPADDLETVLEADVIARRAALAQAGRMMSRAA